MEEKRKIQLYRWASTSACLAGDAKGKLQDPTSACGLDRRQGREGGQGEDSACRESVRGDEQLYARWFCRRKRSEFPRFDQLDKSATDQYRIF